MAHARPLDLKANLPLRHFFPVANHNKTRLQGILGPGCSSEKTRYAKTRGLASLGGLFAPAYRKRKPSSMDGAHIPRAGTGGSLLAFYPAVRANDI